MGTLLKRISQPGGIQYMAICGFNDKIGQGIRLLFEGMIDALEKKAAATSTDEVLQRELVELDNIISVLRTAPGEVLPEMFIALNLLARSLFTNVQNELRSSKSNNLARACREVGDNFIDLLAHTELKSEELRSNQNGNESIAADARKLAQWALERSLQYKPEPCSAGQDGSGK
jgi:hypothetical protein